MDFYRSVSRILSYDPGHRGLRAPAPNLRKLTRSLLQARCVLILTGFPVLSPHGGPPLGETDGPCGSAELASALQQLGCRVAVATDPPSFSLVTAALSIAAPGTQPVLLPSPFSLRDAAALLTALAPTHVVALERPGKGLDGHFHSMRGRILDTAVADTDPLFALAQAQGLVTIAIGDGGNELGMGSLRQGLTALRVPHGAAIAAQLPADYPLTAGVSNWWGPGLAALLSHATQKNLLPSGALEEALLRAISQAGGIDGCTGQATCTVDGLPLPVHLGRRAALARLLRRCS